MEDTPSSQSPRYVLSRVVLANFKSYAGRITISKFSTGYTAVVGPNGCGKSNLLEALLFAFGKRASKMRSHRLEELIHKPTIGSPPEFAAVEIHFSQLGGTESTILKRVVQSSGTTFYQIDGNKVDTETVTRYLKGIGVDLEHNRFMILQGEVELISSMSPKSGYEDDEGTPVGKEGLLEFFDELIGTRVFHAKLCATDRKITALLEDLPNLMGQREAALERLGQLKAPVAAVISYIRQSIELYQLRNVLLHFELYEISEEMRIVKSEQEEWSQKKDQYKKREDKVKEQRKEIQAELDQLNSDLHNLERKSEKLKKKFNKLDSLHTEDLNKRSAAEEKLKSAQGNFENYCRRRANAESEYGLTFDRAKELKDLQRLNAASLEQVQAELRPLQEEIEEKLRPLRAQLAPLVDSLRAVEAEVQKINGEIAAEKNTKTYHESQLLDIERNREQMEEKVKTLQEKVQQLDTEDEAVRLEITRAKSERDDADGRLKDAKAGLSTSRNKLQDIQHRLDRARQNTRKTGERTALHSAIHLATQTKELQGVLGRLGDLGAVPSRLDIAISTLFQAKMNSYVAVSISAAEQLIEFVRRRRLGKITVYSLEKVIDERRSFQSPHPSAVRIFDQVQVQREEVAKVFYNVLRDTLITEDIATARHIAFELQQRWDVATYAGDIVRRAGDMQGFAGTRTGAIQLLEHGEMQAGERIETLETEVRELETQAESDHQTVEKLQAQLNAKWQRYQALEVRQVQIKHEHKLLSHEISRIQEELTYQSDPSEHQRGIKLSIARIEQLQQSLASPQKNYIVLGLDVERIKAMVDGAKPPKVIELETKEEHFSKNIELNEMKLQECNAKIHRQTIDINSLKEKIMIEEAKITEFTNCIQALNFRIKSAEEEGNAVMNEFNVVAEELNSKKARKKEMEDRQPQVKEKLEKLASKCQKARVKLADLTTQVEKSQQKADEVTERIKRNRSNYETDVEEYTKDIQGLSFQESEEEDKEIFELQPKRSKRESLSKYLFSVLDAINVSEIVPDTPHAIPQAKSEVTNLITNLEEMSKNRPQWDVLAELREVSQRAAAITQEVSEHHKGLNESRADYYNLRMHRLALFKQGFDVINESLKKIYTKFTGTGLAEIEFLDGADPFAEGICLSVRPPEKSWKKMAALSGGEKTLVSLSLIFALHEYKPNSIYLMDEIDASLDFINVQKVADYIRRRKDNAQFIIVSLRFQMFEFADTMIGVYKPNDQTLVLPLCPQEIDWQATDSANPILTNTLALSS